MYAIKDNLIRHVNAADIQPFIDDGGYEFWDDDKNVVTGKKLQEAVDKEIKEHSGDGITIEQLIEQLKAQGINLKGD